ncbi:phosphoribosylaminoimidazolesuccinocarboxamide synthase [Lactobacillus sp. S2-2]|uniref:phosphoribosylaminoimidazolesuccinocarboxamide synthase n=1 Tax=Lactobacillus sp. S2-2 TaxID=2692917 RepID=UPI001F01906C|nr:phosphoribosylaminoimidazolesuccinocarboxamide synthase [Lactobacillus sp. S2-2]MCF6515044.1 phosphoribosylaminoimidazolesuccinocarboxamide synthase [Lactobacillus sp. S2-2]
MSSLVASGKTKELFETDNPNILKVHYTDHTTAGDGERNEVINNKGKMNNEISSLIFSYLKQQGIENHFIEQISDTDQLNKRVNMIPLEIVVRNYAAGHFQKRFALNYLDNLKKPVVEMFWKNDELHDPFINEDDAEALDIINANEIKEIKENALKVNQIMSDLFDKMNLILVDFKLEFGFDKDHQIILADEISPDSCRIITKNTKESLDKDIFRKQTGDIMKGYQIILDKLKQEIIL